MNTNSLVQNYPVVPLGDHAKIESGYAFRSADWRVSGVPVVKITSISGGRLSRDGLGFVDSDTARKAQRFSLKHGDVLVAMTGASLGSMALVQRDDVPLLLNQRVGRIVATSKQVDDHYLYFVLSNGVGSEQLINLGHGSAQPNLSSGDFGRIQIPLPRLEEQRAIAGVLSALDDKIESNRRLQEFCMLLATAEHLCWRTTLDSLRETTFGDFCDVYGGATPSTEEPSFWGGEFAWLTPTDVTALGAPYLYETSRTLTAEGLRAASTRMHPIGTIFMTSRATIGAFAIAQIPCSTNQGFIAVQPRVSSHRLFIFHEMRTRVQLMFDMSSGSTFRELRRGTFKNLQVSVPTGAEDFERLAAVLEPLHFKGSSASRENTQLIALRDALLPELLSGRLRVRDAESMVENV